MGSLSLRKNMRQRAKLLIDVPHPDDREMLDKFCLRNDLKSPHCNIAKPSKKMKFVGPQLRITQYL